MDSDDRLELSFSQWLEGFFFMMLDEPVRWDDTVDKEAVLDYVFAHQRVTKVNDAMLAQYGVAHRELLEICPHLAVLGGCCGTDPRHVREIALACSPARA